MENRLVTRQTTLEGQLREMPRVRNKRETKKNKKSLTNIFPDGPPVDFSERPKKGTREENQWNTDRRTQNGRNGQRRSVGRIS